MSEIDYTGPNGILVDDEGVRLGLATELNFVGAGVTATLSGSVATITIPGSGLSALSINNTVFVDKTYGNDATGVCERMDKPFLTIAAARTAAIAFFVGGDAPSATNRILMKLQPGYYQEQILLWNFFDWDFTDSVITSASVTISDAGFAVDSIIYGNGKVIGTTVGTVSITGEGSYVRMFCDSIVGQGNAPTIVTATSVFYLVCIAVSSVSESCLSVTFTSSVTINNCTLSRGSTAGSDSKCITVASGNITFNNCIITSALNSSTVCSNVTPGVSTYNSTRIVATGTNSSNVSNLSGTMILKNVTMVATGSGKSVVANSTVKIYGACEANLAVDTGVTTQVGLITIDSNVV